MKVMYEKPEVKLVRFDLDGRIMTNSDTFVDPWGDDVPSTNDVEIPEDTDNN